MKNAVALLAVASGIAPAAATFGKHWQNATPYTCPGNSDNKCDDGFKGGLDWGSLTPGSFSNFNGFDFNGWSCEDDKDLGKVIKGNCGGDSTPSFGCGSGGSFDKFSVKEFNIDVEFDCRLEFHYDMPDGSTCKHSSSCKKGGNTVSNSQCGGAKNVKVVFPDQPDVPKANCDIKIPKIDFDCGNNTPPPCTGDSCNGGDKPCEGDKCDDKPCEGDKCDDKPCEGDKCDDKPCEGDKCDDKPCEGDKCDDKPCEGDKCDDKPCEGDKCDDKPCEGDKCDDKPCKGDKCSPTGEVPTPTGGVPTGDVPTGEVPTPTGGVPTGEVPTPTGGVPTGSVPTPSGNVPTPTGGVPTGDVPTGEVPTPSGDVPTSEVPTETPGTTTAVTTPGETPVTSDVHTDSSELPETTPSATGPEETTATETGPEETTPAETAPTETSPGETTPAESTPVTTVWSSTSTVYTTSTRTITSCGPEVTNCPADHTSGVPIVVTETIPVETTVCPITETVVPSPTGGNESPVESNTPETPGDDDDNDELPCPEVVPKCLNSWLHTVEKCKNNVDVACFCPNQDFVDNTLKCLYAYGETDDIVAEAVSFFQGMCAGYIGDNPAIVTGIAPITDILTVTGTPTVTSVPYTTVIIETTVTEPCVSGGSTISSSSTVRTISTEITVPQISVPAPTASGNLPASTGASTAAPTAAPSQTFATSPIGSHSIPAVPTVTGDVPISGANNLKAMGLGLAAMLLAFAL